MKGYRSAENPSGPLTFNPLKALNSTHPIDLPCGKCKGCRLERSRQWAIRMSHESKLYEHNCFITLTYNNESVPTNYSVDVRHWQLFMKKLRKSLPQKIRFFACGEYGDDNYRPHYHAIIFNHDFHDRIFFKHNKQGDPIYISETLTNLWSMGNCTTQDVTFKSCGYVARYVTKKIGVYTDSDHYFRISPMDGKPYHVRPEFAVMSRRPGIGTGYVEKFKSDFYPSGYVVVAGKRQSPPDFYVKQLSEEEQHRLKLNRIEHRQTTREQRAHERSNWRRDTKAQVRDAKIKSLKRDL